MNSVLITGGAGFIGSHLVERLLEHGQTVYVIDNVSTGRRENLAHLEAAGRLEVLYEDIRTSERLDEIAGRVDGIYHLAASVGVGHIMDNLIESIENNIHGTERVLEAAHKAEAKVLITSTSEVYGKRNDAPSREDDDLRMGKTVTGRWSYACSKALDEYLAFAYSRERDLPVTVARLFNTVGDRQTDAYGMVIPTFVNQALAGAPLTVHGDGSQTRCFAYVKDVAWGLQQLMESPDTEGRVYNLGSTEQVTIDGLADRVIDITNSSSVKRYIPYGEAYKEGFEDASRRVPNIEKARNTIGWDPPHTLDDIIRITAHSLSSNATTNAEAKATVLAP